MPALIGYAGMRAPSSAGIGGGVLALLLFGTLLGGCTAATTVPPSTPQTSSSAESIEITSNVSAPQPLPGNAAGASDCDAAAAQFAVGETATPAVIDSVKARSRASVVRVLRAGEGATREFIGGRVNIQLDAAGRIADIRCG